MEELISIIIPVYKVAEYLDKCMRSVVNQTYRNLDIILVDDGSPDICPQMCDDWAGKDSRIRVIHKKNAGLGMARNSGLDIAEGAYVMFVDSDDYLSLDAVQVLYERIKKDGSDIAAGKHVDTYADGSINDRCCRLMDDCVLTTAELFNQLGTEKRIAVVSWGKLYKRQIFQELRYNTLKCSEDAWLFTDIFAKAEKVSIVASVIYFYYQRSDSLVHKKSDQAMIDDVNAALKMTQFLYTNGYDQSADRWYESSVLKAYHGPDKRGIAQIGKYFSRQDRILLWLRANLKTKVRLLAAQYRGLFRIIRAVKKSKRDKSPHNPL